MADASAIQVRDCALNSCVELVGLALVAHQNGNAANVGRPEAEGIDLRKSEPLERVGNQLKTVLFG